MKKTLLLVLVLSAALAADAQKVLTVKSGDTEVTQVQAGNYDRIVDEWKVEAGKAYLMSLPARLDGYYFGPDAQRMQVISWERHDDGSYVVAARDMADLDDFQPGQVYLIVPDVAADTIMHVTPGVMTEAKAGKLMLEEAADVTTGIGEISVDLSGTTPVYDLLGRKATALRNGQTYIVRGRKITIR